MTDLNDPQWVAAELKRRGIRPVVDGEAYRPDSHDDLSRWARLGGGQDGDLMTADLVNRGRLVEAMQREEART